MMRYFSIILFLNTIILSGNSFADIVNSHTPSLQAKIAQAEANALRRLQQRLPAVPNPDNGQSKFPQANSMPYPTTQSAPNTALTPQSAPTASSPQNPWVRNNPWAEQAKQNPWANQSPPAPTTNSTYPANTNALPPPPNIFAPNQTNTSAPVSSSSTTKK
jgi:hypothetical protein